MQGSKRTLAAEAARWFYPQRMAEGSPLDNLARSHGFRRVGQGDVFGKDRPGLVASVIRAGDAWLWSIKNTLLDEVVANDKESSAETAFERAEKALG